MAKCVFKPEKLPPTSGAAMQHALRANFQYRDWLLLESQSLDPREFGWSELHKLSCTANRGGH